jgi:hypothetical protein
MRVPQHQPSTAGDPMWVASVRLEASSLVRIFRSAIATTWPVCTGFTSDHQHVGRLCQRVPVPLLLLRRESSASSFDNLVWKRRVPFAHLTTWRSDQILLSNIAVLVCGNMASLTGWTMLLPCGRQTSAVSSAVVVAVKVVSLIYHINTLIAEFICRYDLYVYMVILKLQYVGKRQSGQFRGCWII